ncbi:toxin-antitoxin system HicB family antitoxin [Streptomyces camelliae]|uniref:Toxin-antitoxin system HicB family antitoxin n=1 Tax=Streptomyces camelliae TaxID=3004093 RepID=A0ABY7P799_9ACTN|nr:toxin-antitoxin system HicB family antitoxin [Streptomyces sp. HUAS 2-6]WBO65374.1 toxin-antitoxin system HicB family antitoxin [Streptomyces sp. HUAS 2-6]
MTTKMTVSLSDESAGYVRTHAPEGNVSAFIDRLIRRQITLDAAKQLVAAGYRPELDGEGDVW